MLRQLFALAAAIVVAAAAAHAARALDPYAKPDFAFPTTVAGDARATLARALAHGDGPLALRSLMNLSVALTEVDGDSAATVLADMRRAAATLTRPADRALVSLLAARAYHSLYRQQQWTYDRREQPAEPTDDYRLWSGEQWREAICALLDSALARPDLLVATRLADYAKVISTDSRTAPLYPTVLDFVASQAAGMLPQLGDAGMLPMRLLCPSGDFLAMRVTVQKPLARRVLAVYAAWIALSEDRPDALLAAELSRLEFVEGYVHTEGDYAQVRSRLYAALYALWAAYQSSPYAAEALIRAYNALSVSETPLPVIRQYIAAAEGQVKAHKGYFRNGWLRRYVACLRQPYVAVSYPQAVSPDEDLAVTFNARNATAFAVNIYAAPYQWSGGGRSFQVTKATRSQLRLVKSLQVEMPDSVAPFRTRLTLPTSLPEPGAYIIAPVLPGQDIEEGSYSYVHCSALRLGALAFCGQAWPFVVDAATGAPVAKATLEGYAAGRERKRLATRTTDADGLAQMPADVRTVFARRAADSYARPIAISSYYPTPQQTISAQGFTALALYHPGDTVEWAAVAQTTLMQQCRPLADRALRAVVYDANRQPLDTAVAVTDPFGRVEGRFPLPTGGLTGKYHIRLSLADSSEGEQMRWNAVYFTVSDYKMPTYRVEIADIERDAPSPGCVTLSGRAVTYSGFPVADAAVAVSLSAGGRRWWSAPVAFASLADTTDAQGRFAIVATDALLNGSPVEGGAFTADITVTSPTGENQTATTAFTLGKPLMLNASVANANVDASQPLRLALSLTTPNGVERTATLAYALLRPDSTTILSGEIAPADPTLDLAEVPSGVYSLRIAPVDTTLADPATISGIVVYRPTDGAAPDPSRLLWLPATSATAPADGTISQLYATTADSTWVLHVVTAADSLLAKGWTRVGPGMHRFDYRLPDGRQTATLILAATIGDRYATERVAITRETLVSSLDIAIESFRDRIAPGDTERWTLRIGSAKPGYAAAATALMLDVYNHALDALAPHSFAFAPQRAPYPGVSLNLSNSLDRLDGARSKAIGRYDCPSLPELDFITWGRPLVGYASPRYFGRANGVRAIVEMAKADDGADVTMDCVSVAPLAAKFSAGEAVAEEAAVDEADAGVDGQGGEAASDDFEYRDAATPLALFAPMLTTEADGTLRLDFTAPNANATWTLRAIAYTADMVAGQASRQLVAAKPVMVQPLLPRFLRQGDRAELRATVMNAADTAATVAVRVELFDPADGHALAATDYAVAVAAGGSATIATAVDAPADALMVGYRVWATMGRYADGEQTVIPILAAAQPVVESTPFYIPADTLRYAVKLPKMGKDARVTLQFCENPAWYVATALPGLRADEQRSATASAAALFSAAVADGLLRDQPEIAAALRRWRAGGRADTTLTSMLERNADLKIALLGATPWILDARAQTERMERLALLFDRREVEAAYASSTALLGKLQQPDGGLAWTALYPQSSLWATESVLLTLGQLRQMGYLPDNTELDAIIARAVAYLDRAALQACRKHPDATDATYVYVRSFYPATERPGECAALTSRTVAELLRSWRDMAAGPKAVAALILNAYGQTAAARQAVASLRDCAVTSPERGMWWPSLATEAWWSMGKVGTTAVILDAFAAVDPGSPAVDLIRQWLILEKEANDWGTSLTASQVVATFLRTGSQWTRPAAPVAITVGRERVAADSVEALLGEMRVDISALKPSGKVLAVGKSQPGPSWGAVVSQYVGDMAATAAARCADLSIDKRLLRRVATPEGHRWEPADTLRVGDVVMVDLVVTAARDLDYVAIIDNRAACLEPVDQLPTPLWAEGICFYREHRDAATDLFVTRLPKGTYRLTYQLNVAQAGVFASGLATIQSQYAPAVAAHSAGARIEVAP